MIASRGPGLLPPLVLLASVVAAGTVGYITIEGWNAWDAFYMTVTTVATVGYREVNPLSRAGQVFTVFLVFGGVGTALYASSAITAVLLEGGWRQYLMQWRQVGMIDRLSNHYVLCGYGRIGAMIAHEFQRQRAPFVVVERDVDCVRDATGLGLPVIKGDASREDTLKRGRIEHARGLVAAVGTDAENVYAVLTARVLKPDLFENARAESEDSIAKLKKAGSDRVVSPYQVGAVQMAQTALRPAIVDFVEIATSSDNLELSMEQVKIGTGSPLEGHSLGDASLRQRFSVVVVGIQRSAGRLAFNPSPEILISAGDQLVVLGNPASLKELEQAAQ